LSSRHESKRARRVEEKKARSACASARVVGGWGEKQLLSLLFILFSNKSLE
jgi:hypothetical protein